AFLIALGEEGQVYRDLSLGDVGYLTYYLLMTAALLRLMPIHLSTRRQAGQALDGLIIAGTAATGLWGWLLSDLVTGLQGPFGLLNVTYVLLDLVILSLSLMLLQIQQYSRSSLLLATGLIAFVAADIVYLAQGTLYQTGTSLDLLWSWGTGLQVAGLWALPRSAGRRPAALPRASKPLGLAAQSLPYATVLLASLMLGLTLPAPTPYSQGMLWGTVVVVALATVRQWLTIYDNRAITRELQQSRAELEYLAYHDHLTGLPNRTALTQFFGHGLSDTEPYTIFSLDLDGFKQINDMYGHVTGDQMLRHAAEQLQRAVPTPSRVFRWGGDEFVVVVPGLEHPADAAALAQRLLSSVQRPLLHGEHQLSVGTSVGYAIGRGPQHYQTLLAQADQQMYRVKESSGKRR
ncbi:MAG: GGDEF domain-containing protein, partial [Deinococcus sp.]|nr:GGDEF domain-containing protein [Deinococcus sp.]